jgi:hypothetical protein
MPAHSSRSRLQTQPQWRARSTESNKWLLASALRTVFAPRLQLSNCWCGETRRALSHRFLCSRNFKLI